MDGQLLNTYHRAHEKEAQQWLVDCNALREIEIEIGTIHERIMSGRRQGGDQQKMNDLLDLHALLTARRNAFTHRVNFDILGAEYAEYTEVSSTISVSPIQQETAQKRTTNVLSGPPIGAKRLIYLFLSEEQRIALIGDLDQEYVDIATDAGEGTAKIWYWKYTVLSLIPIVHAWLCHPIVRTWLRNILTLGGFGALIKLIFGQ